MLLLCLSQRHRDHRDRGASKRDYRLKVDNSFNPVLEHNLVEIDERIIRIRGKGEKDRIVVFDDGTREILV